MPVATTGKAPNNILLKVPPEFLARVLPIAVRASASCLTILMGKMKSALLVFPPAPRLDPFAGSDSRYVVVARVLAAKWICNDIILRYPADVGMVIVPPVTAPAAPVWV